MNAGTRRPGEGGVRYGGAIGNNAFMGPDVSRQRVGDIRARWTRTGEKSTLTVQLYYQRVRFHNPFSVTERLVDLDLSHSLEIGGRQRVTWGAGLRWAADSIRSAPHMGVSPGYMSSKVSSAFIEDEIAVKPDSLYFSMGTKIEHDPYSGFEVQPNVRLGVKFWRGAGDTIWAV